MAVDRNGKSFLQQYLENATQEQAAVVLDALGAEFEHSCDDTVVAPSGPEFEFDMD